MNSISDNKLESMSLSQKEVISQAITKARIEQGLSVRQLADKAGMKHPQVVRVTNCENYTRDTLFAILDALDLTAEVREKEI